MGHRKGDRARRSADHSNPGSPHREAFGPRRSQTSRTLAPHRARSLEAIPPHRHPRDRRPHDAESRSRTRAKPNAHPAQRDRTSHSSVRCLGKLTNRHKRSGAPSIAVSPRWVGRKLSPKPNYSRSGHRPGRRLDSRRDGDLHHKPLDSRDPRPAHPPRRNRSHSSHRDRLVLPQL
jgi:hypothetical protein